MSEDEPNSIDDMIKVVSAILTTYKNSGYGEAKEIASVAYTLKCMLIERKITNAKSISSSQRL